MVPHGGFWRAKNVFRVFLPLVILLLTPSWGWSFSANDVNFNVYAGGLESVSDAFMVIAHIFNNDTYSNIVAIVLMLGSLIGAIVGMLRGFTQNGKFSHASWIIPGVTGLAIYSSLFAVKGDLHVIDDNTGEAVTIGQLPQGVLWIAGGLNQIEMTFIDLVEAARSPGIGKSYKTTNGGFPFGVLLGAFETQPVDAFLSSNLNSYIEDCVVFELTRPPGGSAHNLTVENLINTSNNFIPDFEACSNPAVYTSLRNAANPTGTAVTCSDLWTNTLKPALTDTTAAGMSKTFLREMCAKSNIDVTRPLQLNMCETTMLAMLQEITGTAITADTFATQISLAGKLQDALVNHGLGSGMTTTINQKGTTGGFGSLIAANEYMPTLKSGMTSLAIGLIPLLALFLPTPVCGKALSTMTGFFIWIATWGVIDSIVHGFAVTAAYHAFEGIGASGSYAMASLLNMPSPAMKALALFGTMRMGAMMTAGLVSMMLVKFGGHALVGSIRGMTSTIQAGAAEAGQLATPRGMAQRVDALNRAVPTLAMANSTTFDSLGAANVAQAFRGLGSNIAISGANGGAQSYGERSGTIMVGSQAGQVAALTRGGQSLETGARKMTEGATSQTMASAQGFLAAADKLGNGNRSQGLDRKALANAEGFMRQTLGDEVFGKTRDSLSGQLQTKGGMQKGAADEAATALMAGAASQQLRGQLGGIVNNLSDHGEKVTPGAVAGKLSFASVMKSIATVEGARAVFAAATKASKETGLSVSEGVGVSQWEKAFQDNYGKAVAYGSLEAVQDTGAYVGADQAAQRTNERAMAARWMQTIGANDGDNPVTAGKTVGAAKGRVSGPMEVETDTGPGIMQMTMNQNGTINSTTASIFNGGTLTRTATRDSGGNLIGQGHWSWKSATHGGATLTGSYGSDGDDLQTASGVPIKAAIGVDQAKTLATEGSKAYREDLSSGVNVTDNHSSAITGEGQRASAEKVSDQFRATLTNQVAGQDSHANTRDVAQKIGAGLESRVGVGALLGAIFGGAATGGAGASAGAVAGGVLDRVMSLLGGSVKATANGGVAIQWGDGEKSTLSKEERNALTSALDKAQETSTRFMTSNRGVAQDMAAIAKGLGLTKTANAITRATDTTTSRTSAGADAVPDLIEWASNGNASGVDIPDNQQGTQLGFILAANKIAGMDEQQRQGLAREYLSQQPKNDVDTSVDTALENAGEVKSRVEEAVPSAENVIGAAKAQIAKTDETIGNAASGVRQIGGGLKEKSEETKKTVQRELKAAGGASDADDVSLSTPSGGSYRPDPPSSPTDFAGDMVSRAMDWLGLNNAGWESLARLSSSPPPSWAETGERGEQGVSRGIPAGGKVYRFNSPDPNAAEGTGDSAARGIIPQTATPSGGGSQEPSKSQKDNETLTRIASAYAGSRGGRPEDSRSTTHGGSSASAPTSEAPASGGGAAAGPSPEASASPEKSVSGNKNQAMAIDVATGIAAASVIAAVAGSAGATTGSGSDSASAPTSEAPASGDASPQQGAGAGASGADVPSARAKGTQTSVGAETKPVESSPSSRTGTAAGGERGRGKERIVPALNTSNGDGGSSGVQGDVLAGEPDIRAHLLSKMPSEWQDSFDGLTAEQQQGVWETVATGKTMNESETLMRQTLSRLLGQ